MSSDWELVLVPPEHTDLHTWDVHVRVASSTNMNNFNTSDYDAMEALLDSVAKSMREWCASMFGESILVPEGMRHPPLPLPQRWRWISYRWCFSFYHKRDLAVFKLQWHAGSGDVRRQRLTRL